jgi:hypothetical protein
MLFETYTVRVYGCGTEEWFKKDSRVRHRENGPAFIYPSGRVEWWLNGVEYRKDEYDQKMNPPPPPKKMTVEDIQSELGYKIEIVETYPIGYNKYNKILSMTT